MSSVIPGWNATDLWKNRAFEAIWGALYNAGVENERFARPFARLVFGTDAALIYRNLEVLRELPDGSAVLDVPCGGGLALGALSPEQRLRYIAADISPTMLERAERKARHLGLTGIEFVEADIQALPFPAGEFDLCLCVNGLHCLPGPASAVRELARCLTPGGRLVGNCLVQGANQIGTTAVTVMRWGGIFGPGGTVDDVERWFTDAGLRIERLELSGAMAHFDVRKPSDTD
ncbi:class I SAM-dependent methyltransferase [Nocardia sp. NPDC050406]|uniref:class I SAM-dependent methyltransferase n=1 Tax=Nocardia sp. NPDC050406 TaxID=3364318 RepID=UPI0037BC5C15